MSEKQKEITGIIAEQATSMKSKVDEYVVCHSESLTKLDHVMKLMEELRKVRNSAMITKKASYIISTKFEANKR